MIFLDLMLPDMHGLEVLQELRQTDQAKQPFVIIQTGSATKENVEKAVEFGVGAILVKPCNVDQVSKALAKYREQCQAPGADKA